MRSFLILVAVASALAVAGTWRLQRLLRRHSVAVTMSRPLAFGGLPTRGADFRVKDVAREKGSRPAASAHEMKARRAAGHSVAPRPRFGGAIQVPITPLHSTSAQWRAS